jgi:hypothetical protein
MYKFKKKWTLQKPHFTKSVLLLKSVVFTKCTFSETALFSKVRFQESALLLHFLVLPQHGTTTRFVVKQRTCNDHFIKHGNVTPCL